MRNHIELTPEDMGKVKALETNTQNNEQDTDANDESSPKDTIPKQ